MTGTAGLGSERLRLCFISRQYPPGPHLGGVGRATAHLARGFAGRGHDVTVVCEELGHGEDPADAGVNVVRWTRADRPRATYYRHRVRSAWDVADRRALSELAYRHAATEADRGG